MFPPLKRHFGFEGRSRRRDYWLFHGLTTLVTGGLHLPSIALGKDSGAGEPNARVGPARLLLGRVRPGFFIPSLAVAVRRLHHTNRSGWWGLIRFLPLAGALILLIFMPLNGTVGANRLASDPKGENSAAVFS
jgi:uncharacterized membrane protein YhaH (DUF805 family)